MVIGILIETSQQPTTMPTDGFMWGHAVTQTLVLIFQEQGAGAFITQFRRTQRWLRQRHGALKLASMCPFTPDASVEAAPQRLANSFAQSVSHARVHSELQLPIAHLYASAYLGRLAVDLVTVPGDIDCPICWWPRRRIQANMRSLEFKWKHGLERWLKGNESLLFCIQPALTVPAVGHPWPPALRLRAVEPIANIRLPASSSPFSDQRPNFTCAIRDSSPAADTFVFSLSTSYLSLLNSSICSCFDLGHHTLYTRSNIHSLISTEQPFPSYPITF